MIGHLLGHTQAQTTQRYVHLVDTNARKAANEVNALMSGFFGNEPNTGPVLRVIEGGDNG